MNKNLTAKLQKIENASQQIANTLTRCITLEPDTPEMRLKKGFVYTVVNLESNVEFDTEITTKVISDMLKDSYFQAESISPTQSLEKAISEVREKIVQTLVDKQTLGKQIIKLEVVGTVLWGNVLYLVQMGEGAGFLMRENGVKTINTIAEGNFATASGVVKDGDVLILCTKRFEEQTSPSNLLTSIPPSESLLPGQACLVAKFVVDTTFTDKEFVDFAPDTPTSKTVVLKGKTAITGVLAGLKTKLEGLKKLFRKTPQAETQKPNVKSSFETFRNKIRIIKVGGGPVGTIARKRPLRVSWYAAPVVGILLIVAIVVTAVLGRGKTEKKEVTPVVANQTSPSQNQPVAPQIPEKPKEEDTAGDIENKITRVEPKAYYDLKAVDANFDPGEIAVTKTQMVVSDKTAGKIYWATRETPTFTSFAQTYKNTTSLHPLDNTITFADETGYHVIDLANNKAIENIEKKGLGIVYPYLDFVYTSVDDKILKLTKSQTTFTESLWAQNQDFQGTKALVVAYSIFILKADNTVVTYTSGKKDSFELTGLSTPFTGTVALDTASDFDKIYISDGGNRRIVVFDKKGVLSAQYKTKSLDQWNTIKGISVTPDEKTVYVLDGTIVYSFEL